MAIDEARIPRGVTPSHKEGTGGGQVGVLDPGHRRYEGKYQAVSLEEAVRRASMRRKGTLPPIKGGMDDNSPSLLGQAPLGGQSSSAPPPAPPALPPAPTALPPPPPPAPVVDTPVQVPASAEPEQQAYHAAAPAREPDVLSSYRSRRLRADLAILDEAGNSTLVRVAMPVVGAYESEYSITLLYDDTDSGYSFMPSPGSMCNLTPPGEAPLRCYYPGASFRIPELGLAGLCFVKDSRSE